MVETRYEKIRVLNKKKQHSRIETEIAADQESETGRGEMSGERE